MNGSQNLDQELIESARSGDLENVKALLSAGANVHALENSGYGPLQNASRSGRSETVKVLIESGADVRAKDDLALRNASRNGHVAVVKMLIDASSKAVLSQA